MSKPTPEQNAARVLAAEFAATQREMEAAMRRHDNDATIEYATKQAIDFKENLPFILYVLKKFGGLNPPPPLPKNELPSIAQELIGDSQPQSRVMGSSGVAVVAAQTADEKTRLN